MLCFILPVTADVSPLSFILASNGPTLGLPMANTVSFPSIWVNFGCAERYPQVSSRKRDDSGTGERGLHLQIRSAICVYKCDVWRWKMAFFFFLVWTFLGPAVGKNAKNLKNKPSVSMSEHCFYCRNPWFVDILKLVSLWLQKSMVFWYRHYFKQEQTHCFRTKWKSCSLATEHINAKC